MKSKKAYSSPTLKTQVVELGVFGDYTVKPPIGKTDPLDPFTDYDLRME